LGDSVRGEKTKKALKRPIKYFQGLKLSKRIGYRIKNLQVDNKQTTERKVLELS